MITIKKVSFHLNYTESIALYRYSLNMNKALFFTTIFIKSESLRIRIKTIYCRLSTNYLSHIL